MDVCTGAIVYGAVMNIPRGVCAGHKCTRTRPVFGIRTHCYTVSRLRVRTYSCSTPLPTLDIVCLFHFSLSCRCVVVSSYGGGLFAFL